MAFNMDFYERFWSALGCEPVYTSLKTLEEKALIVVHEHSYSEAVDEERDEEGHEGQYFCEFSMHEQIRYMGRRIVAEESEKDPNKRSRVWREEDIRTLMACSSTLQVYVVFNAPAIDFSYDPTNLRQYTPPGKRCSASHLKQENSNVEGLMWRRRMELQQIDT
ncbi:hypothetical protein SUGI_0539450 [Cryptomeria japonica]|nr:hypothetical protein SUGI_0539450 [Cryptomeria japonica]